MIERTIRLVPLSQRYGRKSNYSALSFRVCGMKTYAYLLYKGNKEFFARVMVSGNDIEYNRIRLNADNLTDALVEYEKWLKAPTFI